MIEAAIALLCISGCAKYTSDCELVVRPRRLPVQSSPAAGDAAYEVTVFAFYVSEKDMERWAPQSYADAQAGQIRNLDTGEVRTFSLMGGQGDDTYVHLTLSRSPVVLVAVDRFDNFYAYRTFEYLVPQVNPVTMTLRFVLWKPEAQFTDSYWKVVNVAKQEEEQEG